MEPFNSMYIANKEFNMGIYKVYLSSTTYHWWNLYDYRWKDKLIKLVNKYNSKVRFIDPLKFKSENPIVCSRDIKDINRSNYVVVYLNKITIGTLLELAYCIFIRKNNWCVYTKSSYVLKHPWIIALCKDNIYTDLNKISKIICKKSGKYYQRKMNFSNRKSKHGNKKTN